MRRLAVFSAYALQGWLTAATVYLLALLGVAARRPPAPAGPEPTGAPLRTVVLIPAHDEEAGLPGTLASLAAQRFPAEVIVIADNCTDATAARARAAGVEVWERVHDDRGKGQALAWGIARLARERSETEAVVLIDADCRAVGTLLADLELALRSGAQAAQAVYDVGNPQASATAGLRWAAFALKHRVRPRGRVALGLSAGLFGTGMGFRAELLRRHPWQAFSIAEDVEYHLVLARAGIRVAYVAGSGVESAMPTTDAAAHRQQLRWESGNARLAREHAASMIAAGFRRRDPNLTLAGAELLLPPQTLLVPGCLVGLGVGAVARNRPLMVAAAATIAGEAVYVLAGLRLAGAPPSVYRALGAAPRLAARKLAIFARVAGGRGTHDWLRTEREPESRAAAEVA